MKVKKGFYIISYNYQCDNYATGFGSYDLTLIENQEPELFIDEAKKTIASSILEDIGGENPKIVIISVSKIA